MRRPFLSLSATRASQRLLGVVCLWFTLGATLPAAQPNHTEAQSPKKQETSHEGGTLKIGAMRYYLDETLGGGYSGNVYRGELTDGFNESTRRYIAIKIFGEERLAQKDLLAREYLDKLYGDKRAKAYFLKTDAPQKATFRAGRGAEEQEVYVSTAELAHWQPLHYVASMHLSVTANSAYTEDIEWTILAWHRLMHDLNTAMMLLHNMKLVHGDIKDKNLLFRGNQRYQVTAKSIALGIHKMVVADVGQISPYPMIHTKPFLAPETSFDGNITAVSDHYSAAVMLAWFFESFASDQFNKKLGLLDLQKSIDARLNTLTQFALKIPKQDVRKKFINLLIYLRSAKMINYKERHFHLAYISKANAVFPEGFAEAYGINASPATALRDILYSRHNCTVVAWLGQNFTKTSFR